MTIKQDNGHEPTGRIKLSRWKIAILAMLSLSATLLAAALALLFYLDSVLNTFVKDRITEAIQKANPAYSVQIAAIHYDVSMNRVECDSISVEANDSTVKGILAGISVSGVGWLRLLMGDSSNCFSCGIVEVDRTALIFFKSGYQFRCGRLRLSVPDSEMVADALDFHPTVNDHEFFGDSPFRKTRFKLLTQQCRLTGIAYMNAMDCKKYRARAFVARDLFLDVLINKDKVSMVDTSIPAMPNEILYAMKEIVQIDSFNIERGALKYGESFEADTQPAMITFDNIQMGAVSARDTVEIRLQAEFMKSVMTTISMSIPVSSPEFSFHYCGSLQAMDLRALNLFLEIAEQRRFKHGTVQSAGFDVNVVNGYAGGSLRAEYKHMKIAIIDKVTGSENGFLNSIASFIGNAVVLRTKNRPGDLKIGKISYTRQRDDPFFRFVWFALRTGLADVVGF